MMHGSIIATALVFFAAASPAAAAPVALLCQGAAQTASKVSQPFDPPKYAYGSRPTSFEVVIDTDARTITKDGKAVDISKFDEEEVAFAVPERLLGRATHGPTYILSRRSGGYRVGSTESGRCSKIESSEKLF